MPTHRLTSRNVRTLCPSGSARTNYYDPTVPGFHLRVSPSGARSFALAYRTKEHLWRRYTFGDVEAIGLADARAEARRILGEVAKGGDPQAARRAARVETRRRRSAPTFADLGARFLEESERVLRPNTLTAWRNIWRAEVAPALGRLKPAEVTRADVRSLVEGIAETRPTYANRTFELVRRVFSWAVEKDLLASTPCIGLKRPAPARSRDRVLTDAELRAVWAAAGQEGPLGDALKLLLLTGTRREEVLASRWAEYDLEAGLWRLPSVRAKTKTPRSVPLSGAARELVARLRAAAGESPWAFPSPRNREQPLRLVARSAARIRQRSGVDFVWHDTRRTVRTRLAALGVRPDVAEAILGHAQRGMSAVYNRYEPLPEMRSALEAWAAQLARVIGGAGTAAVVPFERRP
jgi:integrase